MSTWPTFIGGDKLREIHHATVEMTRLVKGVFARIFDNDPRMIPRGAGAGIINSARGATAGLIFEV